MTENLKRRAYDYIRTRLLSGDLGAGAHLSEVDLAKQIGISRTPVREALSQLSSDGLVEHIPRLGAVVKTLTRHDLIELCDLRRVLECLAVARVARLAKAEELDHLCALCDRMDSLAAAAGGESQGATAAGLEFITADVTFHMHLLRAARNQRLLKVVNDCRLLAEVCGRFTRRPGTDLVTDMPRVCREHRAICEAVTRRDAKAARKLMSRHLATAKANTLLAYDFARREAVAAASPALPESFRRVVRRLEGGTVTNRD